MTGACKLCGGDVPSGRMVCDGCHLTRPGNEVDGALGVSPGGHNASYGVPPMPSAVAGIPSTAAARTLAMDPREVTLKRAAWAYGCAKKDSEEERLLLALLVTVIERDRARGTFP